MKTLTDYCKEAHTRIRTLTADGDGAEGSKHEEHQTEEEEVVVVAHMLGVLAYVVEQAANEQRNCAVDPSHHASEGGVPPENLQC